MKEKIVEYGTTHNVTVIDSNKSLITVVADDIKEGFLLMFHDMKILPEKGDRGKIIFERNSKRGYWKLYPFFKLTAENVHNIFMNCLFTDDEPTDDYKHGEGVKLNVGFHPQRLAESTDNIIQMLEMLPDEFRKSGKGGGWSFLNMCFDKNKNQWADLHQTVDELLSLGIAIGKLEFLTPRDMWKVMPGGMPYIIYND